MTADFSSHKVFISGCGGGIGRAVAIHLAGLGAAIGVNDIDAAACGETLDRIHAAGGRAFAAAADLSVRANFHRAVADFRAQFGPVDVMINNASVLKYEPIEAIDEMTLERMIGAGLKTVFWGAQALLLNRDESQPCSIINFSSPVAYRGYPRASAYSSIKGAVAAVTKVMAAELGPRGVRVNALAPGSVPTPGGRAYVDDAEYKRRAQTIPLRRLGHEDDVASAVEFLISPGASFINGAMLSVDGGIIAAG